MGKKLAPLKPGQVVRRTKSGEPEWGPAMHELMQAHPDTPNPKRPGMNRSYAAFVLNLFLVPPKLGGHKAGRGAAEAARLAGFGTETSNAETMASIAYQLRSDPLVQAAIAEEVVNHIKGAAPEVVQHLMSVADDAFHKDRVKALGMLLDRSAPIQTMHTVTVKRESDLFDDLGRLARLMRYLHESGVPRAGLIAKFGSAQTPLIDRVISGQPIDADFQEVDGTEGLEDVL
jgi:hypothetical protein